MQKIKAQGGLLDQNHRNPNPGGGGAELLIKSVLLMMVDSSEERLLWWNLVLLHTWSTFTCDSNELGLLLIVTHRYLALDTNIYLLNYLLLKAINDIQI